MGARFTSGAPAPRAERGKEPEGRDWSGGATDAAHADTPRLAADGSRSAAGMHPAACDKGGSKQARKRREVLA